MILDALGLLSDAQALTATANSTNVIDFGSTSPKRDPFAGEAMCVVLTVDVAADFTTTDETYKVEAVMSAAAALTSPLGLGLITITAARLTAGASFVIPLMPILPANALEFFGLVYTLGGTSPSVTVTAALMPLSMANTSPRTYAKGYTIS